MEKEVCEFIKNNNLIAPNEVVGVACSGGSDSMALLNFLYENKDNFDCEIVCITIDHMIRGEDSIGDALFVKTWCNERHIPCWKFSVDALRLAETKKMGVEEAARISRYGVFEKLLNEGKVDKIALAHHLSDQAETILMHILRGAGLNGACGMEAIRQGNYIRPFLDVSKDEILTYCKQNSIEFVQDESNFDSSYNRNFIRHLIMPELKKRWGGVEQNLVTFSKACKEDNDFIMNQVRRDGVIVENNLVKIPLIYFHYEPSVINRIIFDSLAKIDVTKDIERKHIELIKSLVNADNGKKLNLPNQLVVQKEYDYISLYKQVSTQIEDEYKFEVGKTNFANLFNIQVKRTKNFELGEGYLLFDVKKVPENAIWRTRRVGDKFTKFGGGSKSLKAFLIEKKIPNRLRDKLAVLAVDNEILCIAGVEISESIKVDDNTKLAYKVEIKPIKK